MADFNPGQLLTDQNQNINLPLIQQPVPVIPDPIPTPSQQDRESLITQGVQGLTPQDIKDAVVIGPYKQTFLEYNALNTSPYTTAPDDISVDAFNPNSFYNKERPLGEISKTIVGLGTSIVKGVYEIATDFLPELAYSGLKLAANKYLDYKQDEANMSVLQQPIDVSHSAMLERSGLLSPAIPRETGLFAAGNNSVIDAFNNQRYDGLFDVVKTLHNLYGNVDANDLNIRRVLYAPVIDDIKRTIKLMLPDSNPTDSDALYLMHQSKKFNDVPADLFPDTYFKKEKIQATLKDEQRQKDISAMVKDLAEYGLDLMKDPNSNLKRFAPYGSLAQQTKLGTDIGFQLANKTLDLLQDNDYVIKNHPIEGDEIERFLKNTVFPKWVEIAKSMQKNASLGEEGAQRATDKEFMEKYGHTTNYYTTASFLEELESSTKNTVLKQVLSKGDADQNFSIRRASTLSEGLNQIGSRIDTYYALPGHKKNIAKIKEWGGDFGQLFVSAVSLIQNPGSAPKRGEDFSLENPGTLAIGNMSFLGKYQQLKPGDNYYFQNGRNYIQDHADEVVGVLVEAMLVEKGVNKIARFNNERRIARAVNTLDDEAAIAAITKSGPVELVVIPQFELKLADKASVTTSLLSTKTEMEALSEATKAVYNIDWVRTLLSTAGNIALIDQNAQRIQGGEYDPSRTLGFIGFGILADAFKARALTNVAAKQIGFNLYLKRSQEANPKFRQEVYLAVDRFNNTAKEAAETVTKQADDVVVKSSKGKAVDTLPDIPPVTSPTNLIPSADEISLMKSLVNQARVLFSDAVKPDGSVAQALTKVAQLSGITDAKATISNAIDSLNSGIATALKKSSSLLDIVIPPAIPTSVAGGISNLINNGSSFIDVSQRDVPITPVGGGVISNTPALPYVVLTNTETRVSYLATEQQATTVANPSKFIKQSQGDYVTTVLSTTLARIPNGDVKETKAIVDYITAEIERLPNIEPAAKDIIKFLNPGTVDQSVTSYLIAKDFNDSLVGVDVSNIAPKDVYKMFQDFIDNKESGNSIDVYSRFQDNAKLFDSLDNLQDKILHQFTQGVLVQDAVLLGVKRIFTLTGKSSEIVSDDIFATVLENAVDGFDKTKAYDVGIFYNRINSTIYIRDTLNKTDRMVVNDLANILFESKLHNYISDNSSATAGNSFEVVQSIKFIEESEDLDAVLKLAGVSKPQATLAFASIPKKPNVRFNNTDYYNLLKINSAHQELGYEAYPDLDTIIYDIIGVKNAKNEGVTYDMDIIRAIEMLSKDKKSLKIAGRTFPSDDLRDIVSVNLHEVLGDVSKEYGKLLSQRGKDKSPKTVQENIYDVLYSKELKSKIGDWQTNPKQSTKLIKDGKPITYTREIINGKNIYTPISIPEFSAKNLYAKTFDQIAGHKHIFFFNAQSIQQVNDILNVTPTQGVEVYQQKGTGKIIVNENLIHANNGMFVFNPQVYSKQVETNIPKQKIYSIVFQGLDREMPEAQMQSIIDGKEKLPTSTKMRVINNLSNFRGTPSMIETVSSRFPQGTSDAGYFSNPANAIQHYKEIYKQDTLSALQNLYEKLQPVSVTPDILRSFFLIQDAIKGGYPSTSRSFDTFSDRLDSKYPKKFDAYQKQTLHTDILQYVRDKGVITNTISPASASFITSNIRDLRPMLGLDSVPTLRELSVADQLPIGVVNTLIKDVYSNMGDQGNLPYEIIDQYIDNIELLNEIGDMTIAQAIKAGKVKFFYFQNSSFGIVNKQYAFETPVHMDSVLNYRGTTGVISTAEHLQRALQRMLDDQTKNGTLHIMIVDGRLNSRDADKVIEGFTKPVDTRDVTEKLQALENTQGYQSAMDDLGLSPAATSDQGTAVKPGLKLYTTSSNNFGISPNGNLTVLTDNIDSNNLMKIPEKHLKKLDVTDTNKKIINLSIPGLNTIPVDEQQLIAIESIIDDLGKYPDGYIVSVITNIGKYLNASKTIEEILKDKDNFLLLLKDAITGNQDPLISYMQGQIILPPGEKTAIALLDFLKDIGIEGGVVLEDIAILQRYLEIGDNEGELRGAFSNLINQNINSFTKRYNFANSESSLQAVEGEFLQDVSLGLDVNDKEGMLQGLMDMIKELDNSPVKSSFIDATLLSLAGGNKYTNIIPGTVAIINIENIVSPGGKMLQYSTDLVDNDIIKSITQTANIIASSTAPLLVKKMMLVPLDNLLLQVSRSLGMSLKGRSNYLFNPTSKSLTPGQRATAYTNDILDQFQNHIDTFNGRQKYFSKVDSNVIVKKVAGPYTNESYTARKSHKIKNTFLKVVTDISKNGYSLIPQVLDGMPTLVKYSINNLILDTSGILNQIIGEINLYQNKQLGSVGFTDPLPFYSSNPDTYTLPNQDKMQILYGILDQIKKHVDFVTGFKNTKILKGVTLLPIIEKGFISQLERMAEVLDVDASDIRYTKEYELNLNNVGSDIAPDETATASRAYVDNIPSDSIVRLQSDQDILDYIDKFTGDTPINSIQIMDDIMRRRNAKQFINEAKNNRGKYPGPVLQQTLDRLQEIYDITDIAVQQLDDCL